MKTLLDNVQKLTPLARRRLTGLIIDRKNQVHTLFESDPKFYSRKPWVLAGNLDAQLGELRSSLSDEKLERFRVQYGAGETHITFPAYTFERQP